MINVDEDDKRASNSLKRATGAGAAGATKHLTVNESASLLFQPASYADGDDLAKLPNLLLPTS